MWWGSESWEDEKSQRQKDKERDSDREPETQRDEQRQSEGEIHRKDKSKTAMQESEADRQTDGQGREQGDPHGGVPRERQTHCQEGGKGEETPEGQRCGNTQSSGVPCYGGVLGGRGPGEGKMGRVGEAAHTCLLPPLLPPPRSLQGEDEGAVCAVSHLLLLLLTASPQHHIPVWG